MACGKHPPVLATGLRLLHEHSPMWHAALTRMPTGLCEAAAAALLCLRAVDEIEDHPELAAETRAVLLGQVAESLGSRGSWRPPEPYRDVLPAVTLRMGDWIALAPAPVRPRVLATYSVLASRLGEWARRGWRMTAREDLDQYTHDVSGHWVLLLSDLWTWFDGTRADREAAVGFGRVLQAANMFADRERDLARGADFRPAGWTYHDIARYGLVNLASADTYLAGLGAGPAREFCLEPLAHARGVLERGCHEHLAEPDGRT
jgi:farnesyl-diphosphate farnesyltransferase